MIDEQPPEPTTPIPPPDPGPRLLRRSRDNQVLGGVAAGIGRYFGVDPTLIRLAWLALAFIGGTGVLVYLIAWIVIPEEKPDENVGVFPASTTDSAFGARVLVGGGLVVLGGVLLLRELVPWIDSRFIWPVALIAIGVFVIAQGARR